MRVLSLCLICFIAMIGCKKGEDIPPSIVSDLKAYSGRNRAMVEFTPPAGAVSGKVFFGNGSFKEFVVTESPQQVMIDSLPEGEATIRVVTFGEQKSVSDPKAVKVFVYGESYESTLDARKWQNQVNNSDDEIDLIFEDALETETGVVVVFTNISGALDSVRINNNQDTAVVKNIDLSKAYFYYSIYKPDASSLDEFRSASVDGKEVSKMNFGKAGWSILNFSDERSVDEALAIIDNDVTTSWHSKSAEPASKHWISVDMGAVKYVDGFYFTNSQTNERPAQSALIEVSTDGTSWVKALEAPVLNTFFRQKLELPQTILCQYFRITLITYAYLGVTATQFAEIDAYNENFTSSETGKDSWGNSVNVSMVNAMGPFTGDGSNPFPLLGDKRLQRLTGWTHNEGAKVTFDSEGNTFTVFSANVWGLPNVSDGRVFQLVNLQPGTYELQIDVGAASGPVDMYGLVAGASQLPAYGNVVSDSTVFTYANLIDNQNKKVSLHFVVDKASSIAIGIVYNTHDQFSINGTPWTTFGINSWTLAKVD